jgi:hypothetical protein
MDLSESTPHQNSRFIGPRALIVAALIFHIALAFMFWIVSVGLILAIARLYPFVASACLLVVISSAAWITRLAWRTNTWFAASLYCLASVLTLPWTVIAIVGWLRPT